MDKIQKKEFVKKIKETFSGIGLLVITHYNGLKTSETDELRLKLREIGGAFQVTKNSLMQLVLKENNNKDLKALFDGPTAIAYSKDEISAAKIAVNFSKEHNKLIILGGLMGNKFLEQKDVLEIATLPSLDEIRAKLIALIQTPAKNIAFALKFAATKLTRVFNEYSKLDITNNKDSENLLVKQSTSDGVSEKKTDNKPNNEDKSGIKPETEKN